jgi:hypothetical protein
MHGHLIFPLQRDTDPARWCAMRDHYVRSSIMRHAIPLCLSAAALTIALLPSAPVAHAGPNDFPTFPDLGPYANLFAGICGKNKVDEKPASIPEIGCFAIKAGAALDGKVGSRTVSIRLDADSNDTLYVEGIEIKRTGGNSTNDPLVKPTGTGFAFCTDGNPADCPVHIDALMQKPGEFASFDVARQFKPRSFVTNQENWDAESARTQPAKP